VELAAAGRAEVAEVAHSELRRSSKVYLEVEDVNNARRSLRAPVQVLGSAWRPILEPRLPVQHRLSRFGNRRINAVLYIIAVTRRRYDSVTQAYIDRLLAAGKTRRDALRILKRRLARLVWLTMMRDLAPVA
jgi:hypothetical protein